MNPPDYSTYKGEIEDLPVSLSLPKFSGYPGADFAQSYGGVGASLFVRMLFSCLADADRLATEAWRDLHHRLTEGKGVLGILGVGSFAL